MSKCNIYSRTWGGFLLLSHQDEVIHIQIGEWVRPQAFGGTHRLSLGTALGTKTETLGRGPLSIVLKEMEVKWIA